ncbi:MAG: hypothetical protein FWC93_00970 [Defluviitaleaceae bacterium]|nr:hypothetical protein [Defluviitaleaceae bacterium]
MPETETKHILVAAKEIIKIDEANTKLKKIFSPESGEIQMHVEIKTTQEDCPLMGKFTKKD